MKTEGNIEDLKMELVKNRVYILHLEGTNKRLEKKVREQNEEIKSMNDLIEEMRA